METGGEGSDLDLLTKLQNKTLDGTDLSSDARTVSDSTSVVPGSSVPPDGSPGNDDIVSSSVKEKDVTSANSDPSPDEHITTVDNVCDTDSNMDKHKHSEVTGSADSTDSKDEEPMEVESEQDVDVSKVIRDLGELNQIAEPTLGQNEEQNMDTDISVVTDRGQQLSIETGHQTVEMEHQPIELDSNVTEEFSVTASQEKSSTSVAEHEGQTLPSSDQNEQVPAGLDEIDAHQPPDAGHQDHSDPGVMSSSVVHGLDEGQVEESNDRQTPFDKRESTDMVCVSDIQEVNSKASPPGDKPVSDVSDRNNDTSSDSRKQISEQEVAEKATKSHSVNVPIDDKKDPAVLLSSGDEDEATSTKTDPAKGVPLKQENNSDEDLSVISEESKVKDTEAGFQENIVYSSISADKSIVKTSSERTVHPCLVCNKVGVCKYNIVRNNNEKHLCDDACFGKFRMMPTMFLPSDKTKPSAEDDGKDDSVEIVRMMPPPSGLKTASSVAPQTRTISCAVCSLKKPVKHEVSINRKMMSLCSDKCFASFRRTNKLSPMPCGNCGALCIERSVQSSTTEQINFEGIIRIFCGKICLHAFKCKNKKTVFCAWCKQKKSYFDMVERVDFNNKQLLFCSLNCLSLYRVNLQATSNQDVKCDHCGMLAPAQYHLTMSDASIRNFCSYPCVINFQSQFTEPNNAGQLQPMEGMSMPTANTRSTRHSPRVAARQSQDEVPVISDVVSLANRVPETKMTSAQQVLSASSQMTHIIIQPPKPRHIKNKSLLCKPLCQTKATSCRPHMQTKSTQTDSEYEQQKILLPVPVPIYVPTPMAMYAVPQPYPVPIPVPIPIPCFIPTTKKSADAILKQIKEIQEQMPADPFEAELLMMAEAVATADQHQTDTSEDEEEMEDGATSLPVGKEETEPLKLPANPEVTTTATQPGELGEDMLQMALRMASEISEEPVLDLEESLNPTPVQTNSVTVAQEAGTEFSTIDQSSDILTNTPCDASRSCRGRRGRGSRGRPKRPRVTEEPLLTTQDTVVVEPKPAADANMVLKYMYGVNAWKHWVAQKNALLEKTANTRKGKVKLFKTDILACTTEELNYSLSLFVKEFRKPNGEEYAPDSIFYLCLGIQQYLYENGRIDDIFSSFYYEGFTNALNDVVAGYEMRLNAHGLLVCRIEEEHLWESKQLGAHSPYILLNTLIYFNTKYFFLKTPEEHLRLSFSHIMKHWKRANGQPVTAKQPAQGQAKNVYLRYYAPTVTGPPEPGQKRKREEAPVYEQAENTENPLRCPVKLYEFYLSKCPESIKHRNDVFYLLPERSCVPDSPVWYSTSALSLETMTKMLNRLRLVREIQEAHFHNAPAHYGI